MVHESLIREAASSGAVREFALVHNRRIGRMVLPGTRWVRIRPPEEGEIRDMSRDQRCVKFLRPGTLVTVVEADDPALRPDPDCMVDVSCAGDRLLWGLKDFLGTFIRTVSEDSWMDGDCLRIAQGLAARTGPL